MHRSPYSRLLFTVLTLWMSLFVSESEWVVRCPAHTGSHVSAAKSTAASTAHDHTAGHSTAPENDADHSCACPGPGCCPSAVAAVPVVELPLTHVVAVHEAIAVSTLDLFAEASDYLQPPATAPPSVALAPVA
jgi:hypothetical protein